jgi:hypothetical protein
MTITSSIKKILSEFIFNHEGIIHKQLGIEFKNSEDLTLFLYNYYYCKGSLKKEKLNYYPTGTILKLFLSKLRKANKSSGYYVSGWQILSKLNGHYTVTKNGIKLFVNPLEHFKRSNLPVKIGDTVAIKFPNERIFASRGYYVAIGNEDLPFNNQQTVRLYLHVKPFYAVYLLNILTRQFSHINPIPFIYKTPLDPRDYKKKRFSCNVL